MGLYHPKLPKVQNFLVGLFAIFVSCSSPQATPAMITVDIVADEQTASIQIPPGSPVQRALETAGLTLNALDRTEPPLYTIVGHGDTIKVVRVSEEFEVEQEEIPFKRQTLHNESLPEDEEILIQRGKNGLREITYRKVFEDGVEVTSQPVPVKVVILEEPQPEIRMIGIQAPFSPIQISGQLMYLRDGNVWMIEGSTSNRQALLTTGDLDGRVFSLSRINSWLLVTRQNSIDEQINSLWAANLTSSAVGTETNEEAEESQGILNLQVENVIHFADWLPNSITQVVYSDVEPRNAAPGWQANNNLISFTFSTTGWSSDPTIVVEDNSGGVYGWWGTDFVWGPDERHLAFARPDGVGLVDFKTGIITKTLDITPLFTRGDWAWVPGITWGPDGNFLYTVDHVPQPGIGSPEESQLFDLTAVPLNEGPILHLIPQVGMFSYPISSPLQTLESGEVDYKIAYLQAIHPDQSESSRYRLAVMDRDGSNQQVLFPEMDSKGIEPQRHWGAWSPAPLPETGNYAIAIIYQGNLWIIDVVSGDATQITGDGLTTRVIWKEILPQETEP